MGLVKLGSLEMNLCATLSALSAFDSILSCTNISCIPGMLFSVTYTLHTFLRAEVRK